jgi:hypothetical protein
MHVSSILHVRIRIIQEVKLRLSAHPYLSSFVPKQMRSCNDLHVATDTSNVFNVKEICATPDDIVVAERMLWLLMQYNCERI